jgi:sugar lactone lactonase YvrE
MNTSALHSSLRRVVLRPMLDHSAALLLLPIFFAMSGAARAQIAAVPTITTVAGGGLLGPSDGGPATLGGLFDPVGVALDRAGNLYIADYNYNRIRKVDKVTGIITTVAGNGILGYSGDGGPAISASISLPYGVAVDGAGNLYIADLGNGCIRMVAAATGIITTVAGAPTSALGDGGPATSASLGPYDVKVDALGNLYIADYGNNRVRMVAAGTGIITTVAGNGVRTYSGDGVPAATASLAYPDGIALDNAGNIYISEEAGRIRKVAVDTGIITTVAGTGVEAYSGDGGPATSAQLYYPEGIAVDDAGNLYIGDVGNSRIRKVSSLTGIITTIAGNGIPGFKGDGGPAINAELWGGEGVALDSSGNIYVADEINGRIRRITAGGAIAPTTAPTTSLGSISAVFNILVQLTAAQTISSITAAISQGTHQEYTVGSVSGCVVDGITSNAAGTICIVPVTFTPAYPGERKVPLSILTSTGTYAVGMSGMGIGPQVALTPGVITTVAGNGPTYAYPSGGGPAIDASLNGPFSVAVDSAGNLYIAANCYCVWKVTAATGIITRAAGNGSFGVSSGDGGQATNATIWAASDVAVDSAGNLYIADSRNNNVRMVAAGTGIITTVAGGGSNGSGDGGPATSAELDSPADVAVDSAGNLYIVDGNALIRKVTKATGIITTVAGNGDGGYSGDGGPATSASISPTTIVVDSAGNLYIDENQNQRIRRVSAATGLISTVAGNGTPNYSGDGGAATSASLYSPRAIALDSAGNLYIADATSSRIRRVAAGTGIITTIAGNGMQVFSGDGGPATSGSFLYPQGLALDSAGNLYIADAQSGRVRKVAVNNSGLSFADTTLGSTSTDSPLTATVSNIGNAPLVIGVPATGSNPSLSSGFVLASGTTCPQLSTTSLVGGLASGFDCLLAVSFTPLIAGVDSGSLVLTDDALNATAATQIISLNGNGVVQDTTSTTLSTSPLSLVYGQPVAITATVTDTQSGKTANVPTGSVTFTDVQGGTLVSLNGGTAINLVNGVATLGNVVLGNAGTHNITAYYSGVTGSYAASNSGSNLTVQQAPASVTPNAASKVYGTADPALSGALVGFLPSDNVSGSFSRSPGETVGGGPYQISAVLSPTGVLGNYSIAYKTAQFTITQATPVITWTPGPLVYGTPLGSAQLNASTTVPGSWAYTPTAGTVPTAGAQTLSATFTPTDSSDYTPATQTAALNVRYSLNTCLGDLGHSILKPINADGTSTFKQGSTVPAKFRVCDASGNSVGNPGVVTSFRLVQVRSGTLSNTIDEPVITANPDSNFRWDSAAQQWVFNIDTKPLATSSTYVYVIGLNDASTITFQYGLLK